MSEDAETANREAVIVAVVSSLRKAFGARASAVAEKQIEAATDESLESWTMILASLRANPDHL